MGSTDGGGGGLLSGKRHMMRLTIIRAVGIAHDQPGKGGGRAGRVREGLRWIKLGFSLLIRIWRAK